MIRKTLLTLALASGLLAPVASLHAQAYPNRAIRFIVPYAPGGGADITCRMIAQKMQEIMGQNVIVENRPGASEIVGNEALARSTPDGYTVGFISNSLAINAALQPKLPYDTERDFIPITRLVNVPLVMVVNPGIGVNSIKELVALAKAKPGTLNFASFGTGGPHGLAMEWFKSVTGANIVAINYKGVGPGMVALQTGEVQVMFTGLGGGSAAIRSGKIKAIGATPAKGIAGAPEIPPIARDYPEFDMTTWYGMAVAGGTPADIVNRIHADVTKTLNSPDLRQRTESLNIELSPLPQDQFIALIRHEIQIWGNVIKTAKITVN